MAREQYANLPVTTLDGAIDSSTTTVVVDDGSKMPAANFRIVIELELMFVTSRSSNTLTVVRAIEGTSAASHADTVAVAAIITKGAMDQIALDTIYRSGSGVSRTGALSADDDEFDDDSFSGWTQVYHGSSPTLSLVEQDKGLSIKLGAGGGAAVHTAWMKAKTPSSGDYIQCGYSAWGGGGAYPHFQLIFADGTTYNAGNQVMFGYSPNEEVHTLRSMTGYNTQTAFSNPGTTKMWSVPTLHLRMTFKGSNTWDTFVSPDGIQWAQIHSNRSMGSLTPSHVGFGVTTWNGAEYVWNVKYARFNF